MKITVLVTGGSGFIGSNFIRHLLQTGRYRVINFDALTYAGNPENLADVADGEEYHFVHGDITDSRLVEKTILDFQPTWLVNFAAESHVDRSIDGPDQFIHTNVIGTHVLLKAALQYWRQLPEAAKDQFRFLHVSTDEVYGSLGSTGYFLETTPYAPNSPYAASKASSDHLVRAYHHTYGLPTLTTNCSNNYGPYQFPEKLIPLVILRALKGEAIPVYGTGENIRDWLFVGDHCRAVETVLQNGVFGETYNIGGNNEQKNIDVVHQVCRILDEERPKADQESYAKQIEFVKDRPGHDWRYAIDASKIKNELGWTPSETFDSGIRKTVQWYLRNEQWAQNILSGSYRLQRLGLSERGE